MQKPSLTYLLTCIALIAASLSFWQSASPTSDIRCGSVVSELNPLGLYFAISVIMHLICNLAGFNTVLKWLISILVPAIAMQLQHAIWLADIQAKEYHHPITVTFFDIFIFDVVAFSATFGVVSAILSYFRFGTKSNPDHMHG